MAEITQYIGARYVPLFFTNSVGTPEWESGVMYEPLTIVTYNNNSYTSKKAVPANIGNPSANPEYWAATGVYNAQLGTLINRVDAIEDNIIGLPVSVKHFGAVGDGVSDDTEAFERALENVFVYIPAGTYRITHTVFYKDNQTIVGDGRDNTRIVIDTTSVGITADPASLINIFTNVRFENLCIQFRGYGRTAQPVIFKNTTRLTVKNCKFMNLDGVKSFAEVLVTKDSGAGGCMSQRFIDNYFYKTRTDFRYNTDSWFLHNDWNCVTDEYSLRLQRGDGMLISGNQFIAPLEIAGTIGTQITDNYFDGYVNHDISDRWKGINVSVGCRSLIIANNRFYQIPGKGIDFSGSSTPNQDVTISNNSFEFCDAFADGVPDIDCGSAFNVPANIIGNIGNRYTYWTLTNGVVSSGQRTSDLVPFATASGNTVHNMIGNAVHSGYATISGNNFLCHFNTDKYLFINHYVGFVNKNTGMAVNNVFGMIGKFNEGITVLNEFPAIIRGLSKTARLDVTNDQVFVTNIYNPDGSEDPNYANPTVFISSQRD